MCHSQSFINNNQIQLDECGGGEGCLKRLKPLIHMIMEDGKSKIHKVGWTILEMQARIDTAIFI